MDDQAWALTKLLTDVIDIHAPINQFHVRGGHVPYMTPQWRRTIRHRNRLWNKYKLDPSTTNWNIYRRERNYCTTLRRKAIINYYHHKAESISTKPKDFWKVFGALFHSKRGQANDIVLLENNQYITDKKRMANIFNEYFINIAYDLPIPKKSQYGLNFTDHPSIRGIDDFMSKHHSYGFTFKPSNPTIVKNTVLSLPSAKAMGWENIPIRIIKDGIDSIAGPLSNLFNDSISTNTIPKYCGKFGQITLVFKKGVEFSKTNYRPITVLVAFNDVFERILVNQLYSYFSDKLSPFLSAYRKYYSCETSLLRILEEFRHGLDKRQLASIIGIDVSKVIDSIPHDLLLTKLSAYGLNSGSCLLLENYLKDRFQRVN